MKPFTTIAVVLLSIIALMQLVRFLKRWVVTINGKEIPVWASGVAFVVAGGVAIMLWLER